MAKPHSDADASGLGYAYQLPSGGLLLRLKSSLSQFSDLFSDFSRYISPAYHHDRCERSVHMRLYSMHKREFVMVFLGFFTCFGLGIVIGLTGPPITSTSSLTAQQILANTSLAHSPTVLATGPFAMKSPLTTTYSQQLWLIAKLVTDNNDGGSSLLFLKAFLISFPFSRRALRQELSGQRLHRWHQRAAQAAKCPGLRSGSQSDTAPGLCAQRLRGVYADASGISGLRPLYHHSALLRTGVIPPEVQYTKHYLLREWVGVSFCA